MRVLTDAIDRMAAKDTVELLTVPRAGHNPLDTPKSVRVESHKEILAAVQAFIARCS